MGWNLYWIYFLTTSNCLRNSWNWLSYITKTHWLKRHFYWALTYQPSPFCFYSRVCLKMARADYLRLVVRRNPFRPSKFLLSWIVHLNLQLRCSRNVRSEKAAAISITNVKQRNLHLDYVFRWKYTDISVYCVLTGWKRFHPELFTSSIQIRVLWQKLASFDYYGWTSFGCRNCWLEVGAKTLIKLKFFE